MKKLLLSAFAGFSALASYSQATVPNNSFEGWTNTVVVDSLDNWRTSRQQFLSQGDLDINNSYDIPGYVGATAIHLETMLHFDEGAGVNDTAFGFAINNNVDNGDFIGFPYSDTVDVFKCWHRCAVLPGDQALIIIELSKNGTVYSSAVYPITGAQGAWTQLTVPLVGGSSEEPDSVFVGFVSSEPFTPGVAKPGSWLEVDGVSFEFLAGSTVPAAIPNYSFENWTTVTVEEANFWFSFDADQYYQTQQSYLSKSSTAAHGNYSMQIENTFENIMLMIPSLATNGYYDYALDSLVGGSEFHAQPDQFTGEYQFSALGADTGWVYVDFWNSTSGIHVIGYDTLLAAGTWTPFGIDLAFTEAPDSVLIVFASGTTLGATLLVDHLQFLGGDVSVPVASGLTPALLVYPNPTSNSATLLFEAADAIMIYDMNGRLVYENTMITGTKLDVATQDWENGTYIVQLINNGKKETRKLSVQH